MKIIEVTPIYSSTKEVIVADKIVRLAMSNNKDHTVIHLVDGDQIEANESIKTLKIMLCSE